MRYDRQILLPEIGKEGQAKLKKASVLLVGVGGLGSPIALYLTAAGIGRLGIIDNDTVSLTNLQRQVLYTEAEVGQCKVDCAKQHLSALNSEITIDTYPYLLTQANAKEVVGSYDIVVDGCDNFATRYLINDTCIKLNKPYVYGAICGLYGQVSLFNHISRKNYRDLYPNEDEILSMPPLSKGVVGVTPAIIGSIEATEVLKFICGFGELLDGKLWTFDLCSMQANIILL